MAVNKKRLQSTTTTPTSTPKLALFSLPIKPPRDTPGSKTPPFGTSISIPFQWEEAPGKPRTWVSNSDQNPVQSFPHKPPVARCLELPPRLMIVNESGKLATGLPSPTTVLEGPDHDPCRNPVSPRRISSICTNSNSMSRRLVRKDNWKLGSSWRWGSFREVRVLAAITGAGAGSDKDERGAAFVKLKRSSSFLNNIANLRERLKHATISWRSKQKD